MPRLARYLLLFTLLAVPWGCGDFAPDRLAAPDGVDAKLTEAPGITVMSRNLYLGANIDILLTAQTPAELPPALAAALQQLGRTYFPFRVPALAGEIAAYQPHLVGLQEVSRYDLPECLGLGPTIDFHAMLLGALGGSYQSVAFQENVVVQLPYDDGTCSGLITYTDGDAIIARADVAPTVTNVHNDHFSTQQWLAVAGSDPFQNLRGWNAVTATVAGNTFRFVNTHLEIQQFQEGQVQEAQARELVAAVADEELPLIMVGDFNSAANPHPVEGQATESYRILRNAGFADMWLRQPHSNEGLTCCQASALDNTTSQLHSRLDLVLVRWGPASFGGASWMDVVGEETSDIFDTPLGYTLWPSDHAGVVATLWPAPGRRGDRPGH